MPLEVEVTRSFDEHELLDRLHDTRLMQDPDAAPYRNAALELVTLAPEDLAPAQRYVLLPGVRTILALRAGLAATTPSHDPFALRGGLTVRVGDGTEDIPVIPPVIELTAEPDGRDALLIADGIHRVFAARALGLPITVVVVRGVDPAMPYYALTLPDGWDGVRALEDLPDGFQKKDYRVPDNYKSLFRDYNGQFPGVQKNRKKSNPDHLRA